MIRIFLPVAAATCLFPAHAVVAQDVPGTSPMDHAATSRAFTSNRIDNNVLRDTARAQSARQPTRVTPSAQRRSRSAQTQQACEVSTKVLKSMGLAPHPDCL